MSTRRQRAAYELALCILREGVHEAGGESRVYREGRADSDCESAEKLLRELWLDEAAESVPYPDPDDAYRIFRARIALYLRAWLRADVGDCGPAIEWIDDGWSVVSSRRITPLWERAGWRAGGAR